LLSSKDVAEGYGLSASGLRNTKSRHSDELEEGKHFITVPNRDANPRAGIPHFEICWTKKGVIRLGFLIKTPLAKQFRDWAEDFIIKKSEEKAESIKLPTTYLEALEELVVKEKMLLEMKPKVEIYDDLLSKENLMYPMDGCKKLTANPKLLLKILKEKGYVFNNRKGDLRPRPKALEKGWFVMRIVPNYKDPEDKTMEYMFMTLKGVVEIKPIADEAIAKGKIKAVGGK
jgi:phage antirepressor YoqD-like protein